MGAALGHRTTTTPNHHYPSHTLDLRVACHALSSHAGHRYRTGLESRHHWQARRPVQYRSRQTPCAPSSPRSTAAATIEQYPRLLLDPGWWVAQSGAQSFRTVFRRRRARDARRDKAAFGRPSDVAILAPPGQQRDALQLGWRVFAHRSAESGYAVGAGQRLLQRHTPPSRRLPDTQRVVVAIGPYTGRQWIHVPCPQPELSSPLRPAGKRRRNTKHPRLSPHRPQRGGQA